MTDSYVPVRRQPSRKSKKMRTVRTVLSPLDFEQLLIESRARVMTPEFLVRALLEHILRDNLIEAVIDGDSISNPASANASARDALCDG